MKVISTFHHPSAVSCSAKCKFVPDNREYLVVGKTNRLELYSLQPKGLHLESTLDVWGHIVTIRPIGFSGPAETKLLLLTDHPFPKLILLSCGLSKDGVPTLQEDDWKSLHEVGAQQSEELTDVIVNDDASVVVSICYARRLRVILLDNHRFGESHDVLITEPRLLSVTFISGSTDADTVSLAILYTNHENRPHLSSKDLNITTSELSPSPSVYIPTTVLPSTMSPEFGISPSLASLESSTGKSSGVLIIGNNQIHLFDVRKPSRKDMKRASDEMDEDDDSESIKSLPKKKTVKRRKGRSIVDWPWGEISAWCRVDKHRFLVGDIMGRLAMLVYTSPSGLTLLPLGETSPASTFTYLTSQVVYVGSYLADSLLIRLHHTPWRNFDQPTLEIPLDVTAVSPEQVTHPVTQDGVVIDAKGDYVEVLEDYPNLAPAEDAVLVDLAGSGQSQVVTCSGEGYSGSIKVIGHGANLQEVMSVHVTDAISVFPLRPTYRGKSDTHIVVSTPRETHLFRVDEDEERLWYMDPITVSGLVADQHTLALANVMRRLPGVSGASAYSDSSFVIQVTPVGIYALEMDPELGTTSFIGSLVLEETTAWKGKRVVAASINASQVVIALEGGVIASFSLNEYGHLQKRQEKTFDDEISCVSCLPVDPTKPYTPQVVVGFWGSNRAQILSTIDSSSPFKHICSSEPYSSVPRYVLLHNFGTSNDRNQPDYRPHLMVGLADGTVVSQAYNASEYKLQPPNVSILRGAAVHLTSYDVDGRRCVFACGRLGEVYYWNNTRLQRSQISLKDATWASTFRPRRGAPCLLLCSPTQITFGRITHTNQVSIRSIPTGRDVPKTIVHLETAQAFAVGYVRRYGIRSTDQSFGVLRLLDQNSFESFCEIPCDAAEHINVMHVVTLSRATYLCVGTVVVDPHDLEPTKGRLIVFKVHTDEGRPSLYLVSRTAVQGCVYAMVSRKNSLALSVNSAVKIFKLVEVKGRENPLHVEPVTEWDYSYVLQCMAASGDTLILGDIVRSVALLDINWEEGKLARKARDHQDLGPYRLAAAGDKGVIGSNLGRALFSFQYNGSTTLEEDGLFGLHQLVSKFIPGSVSREGEGGTLKPTHLFCTNSGLIGIVSELDPSVSLDLTQLQSNMNDELVGLGGTTLNSYRSVVGRKKRLAAGFLDGDFLERFLTLDPKMRERIVEGANPAEHLNISERSIDQILEDFQRIH